MNEINANMPKVQSAAPKQETSKPQETAAKEENKGLGMAAKAMIGASALAVAVTGGLLVKKHLNAKELTKQIESAKNQIERLAIEPQKNDEQLQQVFDYNILQTHVDEALKLPKKKEQLSALNEISSTLTYDRGFMNGMTTTSDKLRIDQKGFPKELADAISSKDQYLATKEYIKYCDNLFHESKTAGKTIDESLQNVFGRDTKIKPHTYVGSDEAEYIGTYTYTSGGGYKDVAVSNMNYIPDGENHKHTIQLYDGGKMQYKEQFVLREPAGDTKGVYIKRAEKDGKPVVILSYPDRARADASNGIALLSPNAELTPAQRDLLKLKDSKDLDITDFQTLTSSPNSINYDAILSKVQDAASKIH